MAAIKGVWTFKDTIDVSVGGVLVAGEPFDGFVSNGTKYVMIMTEPPTTLYYYDESFDCIKVYSTDDGWVDEDYRTIDFGDTDITIHDDIYAWITANATMGGAATADVYAIGRETLTEIANAIREKLNTTDTYTPAEMPQAISAIEGGGGDDDGSYDEGYADGKQAEHERFWKAYQKNGGNYNQAFASPCWTDETYDPIQPIICTVNATKLFHSCSKITSTKVPIEVRNCSAEYAFTGCSNLKTIVSFGCFGVTSFSSTFASCSALENITFDGEITLAISFTGSPKLTTESVWSIIDHLADLTDQASKKVSFSATVLGKLTEEQANAITAKNWTF